MTPGFSKGHFLPCELPSREEALQIHSRDLQKHSPLFLNTQLPPSCPKLAANLILHSRSVAQSPHSCRDAAPRSLPPSLPQFVQTVSDHPKTPARELVPNHKPDPPLSHLHAVPSGPGTVPTDELHFLQPTSYILTNAVP